MKSICTVFALCCTFMAFGQFTPYEATLLGHWDDTSIPPTSFYNNPYNEVWGFEQNGQEYAVIGSTQGFHIFDLSQPLMNPHFIKGASTGSNLIHRDMKDFNGFLYGVADEGSSATLQIMDLRGLPDTVTEVYNSNEFVTRSHNLFIDTVTAKLYLLGASGGTAANTNGTTRVLDISTPDQPTYIDGYANANLNMPYPHDGYIDNNIGYFNCGNTYGLWIIDFTDFNAPQILGKFNGYTEQGYNHSGWLSADGKTYYMLDETHGSPIKAVDVTDFTDMDEVSVFDAGSTSNQIAHNAVIRGDYLYVSYYYDGAQIFDVSDPANPFRVAYYPTSTIANNNSYQGAWGIFPLATSGRILVSDMQTGLWYFESIEATLAEKEAAQRPLGMYPNPVATGQELNIILGDVQGQVRAELVDMQGRMVVQTELSGVIGTYTLSTAAVPAGNYILTMRQDGKTWVEQVAIQK